MTIFGGLLAGEDFVRRGAPFFPLAPSELTAEAASGSQIDLEWVDNSNNETGFYIEKSTSSGTGFTAVATVASGTTSYSVTGLDSDTTYYFRVRATGKGGSFSEWSNEASAKTFLQLMNASKLDDSNDYLQVAAFAGKAMPTEFTLEIWLNPPTTIVSLDAIFSDRAAAGNANLWVMYWNVSGAWAGINSQMYSSAGVAGSTRSIVNPVDNVIPTTQTPRPRMQVVVTLRNDPNFPGMKEIRYYFDGVENAAVRESNINPANIPASFPAFLFGGNDRGSRFSGAAFGQITWWESYLTPAEVGALYDAGEYGMRPAGKSVLGDWRFEQFVNTNEIADSSGNEHPITGINMASPAATIQPF